MLSVEAINELLRKAKSEIAAAKSTPELESLKVTHLGRKSALSGLMRQVADVPLEERKQLGALANNVKEELTRSLALRQDELYLAETKTKKDPNLDLSLPGYPCHFANAHPLRIVANKILDVFKKLGFNYVESPEIETDTNNFEYLNIPEDHPARDMWDTLYLKISNLKSQISNPQEKWLLRTHTTPTQVHVMRAVKPPCRVVTVGKVFRREAVDATHLPVFNQVDAFYVDTKVSMVDLKATLEAWAVNLFGSGADIRFRPSYFPFTEPSCEVEIKCFLCNGKSCSTCKNGYIEMLGAGMMHPSVLATQGHDPKRWRGFAFGLGLERVAMVLWGIPDIRLLYENDIDFLAQFSSEGLK